MNTNENLIFSITDACQPAEHVLNAIDGLPALYAAPVEAAL
jgi:hypothetical protein